MSEVEKFFKDTDEGLQQEFLRNLKIRSIEQKFLYFGEGMNRYYKGSTYRPEVNEANWLPEEMFNAIKEYISLDESIGFISLGCGMAIRDRDVLRLVQQAGYNFKLIGVDSSDTMIQKAENLLSQESFNYDLWTEDITTYDFYEKATQATKQFDKVVFMFLGGTIGNMVQTEIVDTLFNIMAPNHILWFDCVVRETNNKAGDLALFNRYALRLQNEQKLNFMFYPLELLGIPRERGSMMLENIVEESIGVLNFRYSFRFTAPYTVNFFNAYIHFIPPERIKLLEIRAYHADTMINYLAQHDFAMMTKIIKGIDAQFVFKKS